ncbi:MAG: metallophosphoesterase [Myxococcales bacterium]|nr:metallophosphoesterase [Myxococcales bacterium]
MALRGYVRLAGIGLLGLLGFQLQACGSEPDPGAEVRKKPGVTPSASATGTTTPPTEPPLDLRKERPWEVISEAGETYLSDVFYAEAAQNEQVMPYAIDGHVMIDRLIYPTLGNPNLYVKSDPQDSFMVVTRLEDDVLKHLAPKVTGTKPGTELGVVSLSETNASAVVFLLVPRPQRATSTEIKTPALYGAGTGNIRLKASEVLVHPEPVDQPDVLKARKTYRFVFRPDVMAAVPAGLYDLRMEIREGNALVTKSSKPVYEYQFNALRVFDKAADEYNALNVTDTQVSVGDLFDTKTLAKLDDFVYFVNTTPDPGVRSSAFITFNGDLHNGGSPAGFRQRYVATTYAAEAKVIVNALKNLTIPIFLTVGNHDGYVATGHVPGAARALDTALGTSIEEVVGEATPKAWPPGYGFADYAAYVKRTETVLGGLHRDIFTGQFVRAPGDTFSAGWKALPLAERNMFLYDGLQQWQKTYGPLYFSWKFGKNRYINLHSYEMRQHRRSGWGMYTVNYGGALSDVQVDWIDRELTRAGDDGGDVVMLAHHDPRGGHNGEDFGYLFEQLEYQSVQQSAINYIVSSAVNPVVCKLPWWAISNNQQEACLHDGLQEWMRPDPEFDCKPSERGTDGKCLANLFTGPSAKPLRFSNLSLLERIAKNPQIRTLIFGHTHYHSYEMWQAGDELLPKQLPIDDLSVQKFATLEIENPVRGYSTVESAHPYASESLAGDALAAREHMSTPRRPDYDPNELERVPLERAVRAYAAEYARAAGTLHRTLDAPGQTARELAVLRLTSNADLTSQKYNGRSMFGFSVLGVSKRADARGYDKPQLNRLTFFINAGKDRFDLVRTVDLDRTVKVSTKDPKNPVGKLFTN